MFVPAPDPVSQALHAFISPQFPPVDSIFISTYLAPSTVPHHLLRKFYCGQTYKDNHNQHSAPSIHTRRESRLTAPQDPQVFDPPLTPAPHLGQELCMLVCVVFCFDSKKLVGGGFQGCWCLLLVFGRVRLIQFAVIGGSWVETDFEMR